MATIQVLEDGPRNYIVNVVGTDAISDTLLVDVSALQPSCTRVRLWQVSYDIDIDGLVTVSWDATADVPFLTLSAGNGQTIKYGKYGGISNNAGAGITGDVLITTAAAAYSVVLWFVKSDPNPEL